MNSKQQTVLDDDMANFAFKTKVELPKAKKKIVNIGPSLCMFWDRSKNMFWKKKLCAREVQSWSCIP